MSGRIAIHVVEDDDALRETLLRFLDAAGMEVQGFDHVKALEQALLTAWPDIILLDVNLPDENGFIAAARLRARSPVGIIMLTGRTDQDDRLLGLSIGADHYLNKPVDLRELETVVRNLARRLHNHLPIGENMPDASDGAAGAGEKEGAWVLDCDAWSLTSPTGIKVDLSAAEYQALVPLLQTPGQPGSRDMINARLGKPRIDPQNRSVDVLISRTRRRIETATGQPLPLRSARGSGYVFTGLSSVRGNHA
ncbi:response regulator transcription factor [Sphingomonas sp.]|uniref:response regulator transcription factor n=1 Tax=Sphingomonas sp. TaxID=28214 RepID=UPI003B3AAADB